MAIAKKLPKHDPSLGTTFQEVKEYTFFILSNLHSDLSHQPLISYKLFLLYIDTRNGG